MTASPNGNRQLLLATNNPGKVRELRRLLAGSGFEVLTPADLGISLDIDENGTTYAQNALLKAHAFAQASGLLSLADDSGIEVDALGGGPGLHSARYGGPGLDDEGRTALLLRELQGIPDALRTARYRAIVALAWPPNGNAKDVLLDAEVVFEGVQPGTIGYAPRGEGGFGYDPVFLVDGERTQAEISADEKDRISHRGQAVRAACEYLRSLFG